MKPITSIKGYQRAKRDLELVESQLVDINKKREIALAGFASAEGLIAGQAMEIRSELRAWEGRNDTPSVPLFPPNQIVKDGDVPS